MLSTDRTIRAAADVRGTCTAFGKRRYGGIPTQIQFVIGIGDKSHHSQVGASGGTSLHVLVDLSLRQRRVAVEAGCTLQFIGFEYFLSVVFGYFSPEVYLLYLEVVFSLNQFGDTLVPLSGMASGYRDFVFPPVGCLSRSRVSPWHRSRRVVVDELAMGAELVETFNQHTFRIEIGESERSRNVESCPVPFPSLLLFWDESGGYFRVVNEVYPPETDVLATPFLVGTVVDNGDTSYDLVTLVCQKIICLTEFECCTFTSC